jgi:hypothetical protein
VELHVYIPGRIECKFTFNCNFILTLYRQGDPLQGLVQRTQPYRNNWIIRVIRDLFFSGGTTSFTARHNNRFIRHHVDSSISCHVPMVMVSLVATGVSQDRWGF